MKVTFSHAQERPSRERKNADIHRAHARLPRRERAVIELVYWTELSLLLIVSRLNVPLTTVKARTRSARTRPAAHLEHGPQS